MDFKTAEKRKEMHTKLSDNAEEQEAWNNDVLQTQATKRRRVGASPVDASGGAGNDTASASLNPLKRKRDEVDEDSEGEEEAIHRGRSRKIQGRKNMGVFWPIKKLTDHFKGKLKPKARRLVTYDGERGAVLDSTHGCPTG